MQSLPSDPGRIILLAYAGGGLAIFFGTVKLFEHVDKALTEVSKFRIALWALTTDFTEKARNLASTFGDLFDKLFTSRHFSWRCAARSALASLCAVTGVVGLLILNLAHQVTWKGALATEGLAVVLAIVLNLLPDYISLLGTRVALSIMRRVAKLRWIVAILIGDLLFSILTYIIPLCLVLDLVSRHRASGANSIYLPFRYFQRLR